MSVRVKMLGMAVSASIMSAGTAVAFEVPRGIDIHPAAAGCNIGPFPQVAKAGGYNALCDVMTDAEKCLALVKANMDADGVLSAERREERAEYCLETFRRGLIQ